MLELFAQKELLERLLAEDLGEARILREMVAEIEREIEEEERRFEYEMGYIEPAA